MKQTFCPLRNGGKKSYKKLIKKLIPDHLILLRGIIGTYRSIFLHEACWIRPQFMKMLFLDSDLLFYVSEQNEAFRV